MLSKRSTRVGILLVGFLAAGICVASAKDSREVRIVYPAIVNGTTLPEGPYQISWVTHSPEATVTFKKGSRVVVTAEGKVTQRDRKFERNEVMYDTDGQGKHVVSEIRLAGTNQAIVFKD